MRRLTAFLIVISMVFGMLSFAYAEENEFSPEAAEKYTRAWQDYLGFDSDYFCGYTTADDGKIDTFYIIYNGDGKNVDYASGLIPQNAGIYCLISMDSLGFGFFADAQHLEGELEDIVIEAGDKTIDGDGLAATRHDDTDVWSIALNGSDVLELSEKNSFTVKFKIDGKIRRVIISRKDQGYLFGMVDWIMKALLYTSMHDDTFQEERFLPNGSSQASLPAAGKEKAAETEKPAETKKSGGTVTPTPAPESPRDGYSFKADYESIDRAAKSLFYVEVYDSSMSATGNASGFVTFDEHLFVTNQHVIQGASCLKILDDDDHASVLDKVIASDAEKDIAILLFDEGVNYTALERDSSEELKRGQPIITIGSPKGYQGTVSEGIISALPRLPEFGNMKCIQITAPISHGSSGGALFCDHGKVIGITSAGNEDGQNLNFCVPIRAAEELYEQWDGKSCMDLGPKSWDLRGAVSGGSSGGGGESDTYVEDHRKN